MEAIFLKLVNQSLSAGWLVLAIMLAMVIFANLWFAFVESVLGALRHGFVRLRCKLRQEDERDDRSG